MVHPTSSQSGGSIMKALQMSVALTVFMLLPQAILAQANDPFAPHHDASKPANRTPDDAPMRQMMEMHEKMQAEMQSADGQLDALLAEMNGSTGEKKVEAIAALLNRLIQERKAMQHRMAEMHMQMMGGMAGPAGDSSPSTPDRMAAREMQQRLAAEREVAEAQMKAQQAAMQAQMEAQKRLAEGQRDAQRALVEQREKMAQELNRARADAERAVAQAREEVAKATAQREEARKEAELAAVEARALAVKAQAAQAEAEKALAEARDAERAARQQAEVERARREKEKK
jgi:hypothetical protein